MASPPSPLLPPVHRVCIIGAGPSGLTALKHFLSFLSPTGTPTPSHPFTTIDVYEQRPTLGGVWNHTPHTRPLKPSSIPLADPWCLAARREEEPLLVPLSEEGGKGGGKKRFVSAMYDDLETNIPKTLMAFKGFPFGEAVPLFPKHGEVLKYIRDYAAQCLPMGSLERHVHFNRVVRGCMKLDDGGGDGSGGWQVSVENLETGEREGSRRYDAVVVGGGNYGVPYVPGVRGLREWLADGDARKGEGVERVVEHSRNFRSAGEGRWGGKKILLIGNSASAIDIAFQLVSHAVHNPGKTTTTTGISLPLHQSIRSSHGFSTGLLSEHIKYLPELTSISKKKKNKGKESEWIFRFADGTTENLDIDTILFCTGYLHTLPYLHPLPKHAVEFPLIPKTFPKAPQNTHSARGESAPGSRIHSLYHHTIYIPDPTLSFLSLPYKVIPFIIAELQAVLLARIYSGKVPLLSPPDLEKLKVRGSGEAVREIMLEQVRGQEEERRKRGVGGFHCFGFPEDAEFIDFLGEWCASGQEGTGGTGEVEWPVWGEKERWIRERITRIKGTWLMRRMKGGEGEGAGEGAGEGGVVRTMEELGFVFPEEGGSGGEKGEGIEMELDGVEVK